MGDGGGRGNLLLGRRYANETWTMPDNPTDKPMGQKWVGDNC